MLRELQIQNLGVIEEAVAEFTDGFTVVTGETGAGKTMVVTGLKLLSGARADSQRVRSGTERATVDGIFHTDGDSAAARLVDDVGGYLDDGEVVVSRSVSSSGRSRAHLAGRTVAAGVLGDFSSRLLTIHGQSDQLQLLDPTRQLRNLDRFAGLDGDRRNYRRLRRAWAALARDLNERTEKRRDLALEAETLRRSLEEIDTLDPQPGEDEDLKVTISRLQDADEVRDAALAALAAIDGGDPDAAVEEAAAVESLSAAASALSERAGAEPRFGDLAARINAVVTDLADISGEIGAALSDVPSPESLEGLLARQQDLRELRKYASDIDGVLAWRDQARERLSSIDVSGDALEELRGRVEEAAAAMVDAARELSSSRTAAAGRFATAVSTEIEGLQMSSSLRVDVRSAGGRGAAAAESADCLADGIDEVEFLLVQGGTPNSLAATASGGELSRVMLALEVVLAGRGRTMVFDEVDSGVGGRAAVEIGRRLARLAVDNQVIVVTHLPQVAAFADAHVHVAKAASEESVRSSVRTLDSTERVEELSRMLAGLESDTGRAHAEELLETARRAKAELDAG
ncbi:DNA repair protein RecN [Corynebacterium glyciniphilum]|uniref:DNA repair protein RecN n=1 Tax=Corynebacterium glyciniphilum AJ 3170 TaxID=1404245 RepID=X5DSN6_9CORY|nr:DNA repair protein RecN [Corynebacterium glyciniphilum]AHW64284.1 DNA repair protein recN [Corynebacterium glyciniphilum AJ 3170]